MGLTQIAYLLTAWFVLTATKKIWNCAVVLLIRCYARTGHAAY